MWVCCFRIVVVVIFWETSLFASGRARRTLPQPCPNEASPLAVNHANKWNHRCKGHLSTYKGLSPPTSSTIQLCNNPTGDWCVIEGSVGLVLSLQIWSQALCALHWPLRKENTCSDKSNMFWHLLWWIYVLSSKVSFDTSWDDSIADWRWHSLWHNFANISGSGSKPSTARVRGCKGFGLIPLPSRGMGRSGSGDVWSLWASQMQMAKIMPHDITRCGKKRLIKRRKGWWGDMRSRSRRSRRQKRIRKEAWPLTSSKSKWARKPNKSSHSGAVTKFHHRQVAIPWIMGSLESLSGPPSFFPYYVQFATYYWRFLHCPPATSYNTSCFLLYLLLFPFYCLLCTWNCLLRLAASSQKCSFTVNG